MKRYIRSAWTADFVKQGHSSEELAEIYVKLFWDNYPYPDYPHYVFTNRFLSDPNIYGIGLVDDTPHIYWKDAIEYFKSLGITITSSDLTDIENYVIERDLFEKLMPSHIYNRNTYRNTNREARFKIIDEKYCFPDVSDASEYMHKYEWQGRIRRPAYG